MNRLPSALAGGNLSEAVEMVRGSWTVPQLVALLGHTNSDVRKVAALALGLVGDKEAIVPLAVALHDGDPVVTQMAEHALWSVWFRLGNCKAVCHLKRGTCHLNHGNYDAAAEHFTRAIEEDPEFAEAYNQRAIAHYLGERYEAAIEDCKAAMKLVPQHFGAMAGLGHTYAHLGRWDDARHCYRLALAIHPRLDGIEQALGQVEAIARGTQGGE